MIKKLLSKLSSVFKSVPDSEIYRSKEARKELMEQAREYGESKRNDNVTSGVAEKINQIETKPTVQLNVDTGKLTFPDGMSDAEKAKIESELMETIQAFAGPDAFKSLEDFLKQSSQSVLIPFTTVNSLPDGYVKIAEEMEHCKGDNEHWNDMDYLEALMGYYNDGYEFNGLEHIYNKVAQKAELLEEEKKMLRDWHLLVSQDQVYEA